MVLRFIKFGWGITVVAALATLLYIYAALPELVVYSLSDEVIPKGAVSRESFFYISLIFLAGINFLLYALASNASYRNKFINLALKQWKFGLAVVINIFFIVALNFIQLVNSGERFNFDYFGYLIYVGLGLILLWILTLPILLVRASNKKENN